VATVEEGIIMTQMTESAHYKADATPAAPRATVLLPIALLLHVVEEWFGGFPAWTLIAVGKELSPERFVLISAVGFLLFAVGTLAAVRSPQMAWFGVSLAALVGLNGALHTLLTLILGQYSPGTVTGLLVYIPLSAVVLRSSSARLSGGIFASSVLFGVLLHGLASFLAFL
jgi:hypothetical protein